MTAALRIALGYLDSGLVEAARAALAEAVAAARGADDVHTLRLAAPLLAEAGDPAAAVEALAAARRLAPRDAACARDQGALLMRLGRPREAASALAAAISLGGATAELTGALGDAFAASGDASQAERAYRHALSLDPAAAPLWNNLGLLWAASGRVGAAIDAYGEALRTGGEAPDVLVNLGAAHDLRGRAEAAQEAYERALAVAPDHRAAADNLLYALHYTEGDPARLAARHRAWGAAHPAPPSPPPRPRAARAGPLTVGLVSPDLRRHSVASFLEPLLRALDPARVRVIAYAEVERPDAVSDRLRRLCAGWVGTVGLAAPVVAERVRADGVDVLVDLAGHTRGNRLDVLALRPAPVQVTWLGYPGTTGLPGIDVRLVDAVTDPSPAADAWASERLVRLPAPFLCYGPPADAPPPERADGGPLTFGSFNSLAKLSAETVALWAAVLRAVPEARLLLKARALGDAAVRDDVAGRFAAHGVAADRLRLVGWVDDRRGHLGLYGEVDVALDPTPYAGTTTTCEALWMGVPVVTLAGRAHAGRVGVSLLRAVGGPAGEGVAADADAYVATAARLAGDATLRASLRQELRGRLAASPLCDGRRFAEAWTAALEGLAAAPPGGDQM